MNISSGIATIHLLPRTDKVVSERMFVWPVYNSGNVERIHGVTRRTESNVIYSKTSPEDQDRLVDILKKQSESFYTSSGTITSRNNHSPGSLFHAIV